MKAFLKNFFLTGMVWVVFNTVFFVLYFLIAAPIIIEFGAGRSLDVEEGMINLTIYRILAGVFVVLLAVLCFCAFRIGKKLLVKFKNPLLTFLSCFLAYAVVAVCIGTTTTNHEFTRAPLEVWSKAVLIRTQDVENAKLSQEDAMLVSQLEIPFSSEEEAARFLFYQDVLLSKEKRCYEIAKSTFLNAVFALLPFGIAYIGLCVRKDKGAEDKKQLAGDSSPA